MLTDALRLAARWAIRRWGAAAFAFAFLPTRREMRAMVERVIQAHAAHAPAESRGETRGTTLH